MGTYGRNFEFRRPPVGAARAGRYATKTTSAAIPIGAPVLVDAAAAANGLGLPVVDLLAAATPRAGGNRGILVYEHGPNAFAGTDPMLTTYSDLSVAPPGAAVQVIHGQPTVKVVFKNTVARTWLGIRSYPGRLMVAPAGLAGLARGDFLTPGAGTDAGGYWAETAIEANAWLVVTSVDAVRGEVEAEMLF